MRMRMRSRLLTLFALTVLVFLVTHWTLIPATLQTTPVIGEFTKSFPPEDNMDTVTLVDGLITLRNELQNKNVSETLVQQADELIRIASVGQSSTKDSIGTTSAVQLHINTTNSSVRTTSAAQLHINKTNSAIRTTSAAQLHINKTNSAIRTISAVQLHINKTNSATRTISAVQLHINETNSSIRTTSAAQLHINKTNSAIQTTSAVLLHINKTNSSVQTTSSIQLHINKTNSSIQTTSAVQLHINKTNSSVQTTSAVLLPFNKTNSSVQTTSAVQLHVNKTNSSRKYEVCPEVWLGSKEGYPFYFTGWKTLNCSDVLPIQEVLSIALYYPPQKKKECSPQFQRVLAGIKTFYPEIHVLVSGISKECAQTNGTLTVRWINDAKNSTPGSVWNMLVESVTTPYVLVGRDMDDFLWTTNLEREVRMISYNSHIAVAGGAARNFTGHWKVGCWQANMRNYVLEYEEGYHKSLNSCMFCDHLTGPFVARTKVLTSIKLDTSLPADVLFEDWFLRVTKDSHKVVNCPDVMYSATDNDIATKSLSRVPWMPLARKWGLNRILPPRGPTFSYNCSEAGLTCDNTRSLTNSFLIPICCIEQFAKAIGTFNDFCRKHNLRYEMESGSVLGLLKMNDMMPWDQDGDITFYTPNISFIQSNAEYFKANGILLKEFSYSKNRNDSFFALYTPDILTEFWGLNELSHDITPHGTPFLSVPTQVELHGHWVYAPHSPGNHARNRYGVEILRHSQSWRQVGLKTSYLPYKSGHFKKCTKPGQHACLDQFSADGNIQFQVPN